MPSVDRKVIIWGIGGRHGGCNIVEVVCVRGCGWVDPVMTSLVTSEHQHVIRRFRLSDGHL